jgi:uncharacterized cofD-like protein
VAIGGGTGLPVVLRALRLYAGDITAVVTVADNGGSSGRLRREFGIPPPGDIRNCLVALARNESLANELFQYRFTRGAGLAGHSLGNLFIAALTETKGDFVAAIRESGKMLDAAGLVLPSTAEDVSLVARVGSNVLVRGQVEMIRHPEPIKSVSLEPEGARALPEAVNALRQADQIIFGPGSLYTSLIANLLLKGMQDAIVASDANKIYVCNAMTQHGETDNYTASDHVRAIWEHSSPSILDLVMINNASVPESVLGEYAQEESCPVMFDKEELRSMNLKVVVRDLVTTESNHLVRHDPLKLAGALKDLL